MSRPDVYGSQELLVRSHDDQKYVLYIYYLYGLVVNSQVSSQVSVVQGRKLETKTYIWYIFLYGRRISLVRCPWSGVWVMCLKRVSMFRRPWWSGVYGLRCLCSDSPTIRYSSRLPTHGQGWDFRGKASKVVLAQLRFIASITDNLLQLSLQSFFHPISRKLRYLLFWKNKT